jgi:hypothetical protein
VPEEIHGFATGAPALSGQVLAAGGLTVGNNAASGRYLSKYTWANADIVALGAALTGDITIATVPARTVIYRVWMAITGQAAGVTTLAGSIGKTAAAYSDYFLTKSLTAAVNTLYGQVVGDYAAAMALYCGDMPSFTAATAIKLHLISTGANLSAVTGSSGVIILETTVLP